MNRRSASLSALAVLVLVALAGGAWYLFLRPPAPAAVTLPASSTAPGATTGTVGSGASRSPAPGASSSSRGSANGGLSGTWKVDHSVGSMSDFSASFVGYRVQETLANVGANTAVGRTPDVDGSVTIEGTKITAASFTAKLTTLRSDNNFRDGQLQRQALETSRYPEATFKLTEPIDLGTAPAEGATFNATAKGDLTLHGVTRSVVVELQGRVSGGVATITGSLPIVFADYSIAKPQSMLVLSVEDHGVMELKLNLTRA